MRGRSALVLGLLAYGAFLAATLPASLVADRVAAATGGRVTVESPEGSLWNGRGRVTIANAGSSFPLEAVRWRLEPARLFLGEAAFAVEANRAGFSAAAVVARTFGETRIRDLKAAGPAAALAPLFPLASSWQPEGTVTASSESLAFDGRETRGAATIEWRDAALSLAPARPLGSWKAELAGKGPDLEIALATQKGPLRLAGKGRLAASGKLEFGGTASADPGREKELEALLALIGPRRPDGLTAITVR